VVMRDFVGIGQGQTLTDPHKIMVKNR